MFPCYLLFQVVHDSGIQPDYVAIPGSVKCVSCDDHGALGTIAIDEHEDGLLAILAQNADMSPDEYDPVGFEIGNLTPTHQQTMLLTIIATRRDEVGDGVNDMIKYANEKGELPVYRFPVHIDFRKFRSLITRLDIKVLVSSLQSVNVTIHSRKPE